MVGFLVLAQADFKRGDNNLTVIDTDTKLEWQDSYKNNIVHNSSSFNEAIAYCEDLELDDKNDWRLPNINELKSIVVDTQYAPSIDEKFKYTINGYYLSSTARRRSTSYKYMINFTDNSTNFTSGGTHIRCVRDAD